MKKKEFYLLIIDKARKIVLLIEEQERGFQNQITNTSLIEAGLTDLINDTNLEFQKIYLNKIQLRIDQEEKEFNNIIKSIKL